MPKPHGKRVFVPTRAIQGGMDFKFETDPYDVELHGLLTPEQYTEAIENLNHKLRPSRSGKADGVLLAAGPLILPLAIWGVRHRNQTKRRKRLLQEGIHEFNTQYQGLLMRWNRRPESYLTIERRHPESSGNAGAMQDETALVQATLVSDVFAPTTAAPSSPQRQSRQQQQDQQQHDASSATPTSQPSSSGLV